MTNTIAQGEALMRSSSQRLSNGGSWAGWCARFVCRFVTGVDSSGSGLGASADTAREALAKSGPIVSKDPSKAPAGAIHWWLDGPTGDGHVAVDLVGGASQLAMASSAVSGWGTASGVTSLSRYHSLRPDMQYAGWTRNYCGATVKAATTPAVVYTAAKSGEGLLAVATRVKVPEPTLVKLNPGIDPSGLKLGQKIRIK